MFECQKFEFEFVTLSLNSLAWEFTTNFLDDTKKSFKKVVDNRALFVKVLASKSTLVDRQKQIKYRLQLTAFDTENFQVTSLEQFGPKMKQCLRDFFTDCYRSASWPWKTSKVIFKVKSWQDKLHIKLELQTTYNTQLCWYVVRKDAA